MSTAVLIVNYRAYDDLSRCLASLLPQLDAADEVVVVDYESDARQLAAAGVNLGWPATRTWAWPAHGCSMATAPSSRARDAFPTRRRSLAVDRPG